jgi:hypothetical protein
MIQEALISQTSQTSRLSIYHTIPSENLGIFLVFFPIFRLQISLIFIYWKGFITVIRYEI